MMIYDIGVICDVRRDDCELYDESVDAGGMLRVVEFNLKIMIKMNAMINWHSLNN